MQRERFRSVEILNAGNLPTIRDADLTEMPHFRRDDHQVTLFHSTTGPNGSVDWNEIAESQFFRSQRRAV